MDSHRALFLDNFPLAAYSLHLVVFWFQNTGVHLFFHCLRFTLFRWSTLDAIRKSCLTWMMLLIANLCVLHQFLDIFLSDLSESSLSPFFCHQFVVSGATHQIFNLSCAFLFSLGCLDVLVVSQERSQQPKKALNWARCAYVQVEWIIKVGEGDAGNTWKGYFDTMSFDWGAGGLPLVPQMSSFNCTPTVPLYSHQSTFLRQEA